MLFETHNYQFLLLGSIIFVSFLATFTVCSALDPSSSTFYGELFHIASQDHLSDNVILSPASIQIALALGYSGARGETAEEIAKGLRLQNTDRAGVLRKYDEVLEATKNHPMLVIANKIWVNHNFEVTQKFKITAVQTFNSEIDLVDFSEKTALERSINDWVLEKTHNKIRNVLVPGSISDTAKMVVVNAIYFKANWQSKFNVDATKKADFWSSAEQSQSVDTMFARKSVLFANLANLNASAIELPYADSEISMVIVLPRKRDGLKELEEKLQAVDLLSLEKRMRKRDVEIHLPKFKAEFSIGLKSVLQKMGIRKIFEQGADFSGIFKKNVSAKLSDIQHKAFIGVDELGSEAAGSTYMQITAVSARREVRKIFKADHPFVFAIKDSKLVYFVGHVSKL